MAAATLSSWSRSRSLTPEVLRPAAADGFGVDADDFAELADEHDFGGVVDELDAGDFAGFGAGFHVDDAGAAAGLEAVAVDVGAFAEAVFADGEDEAGGEAEFFVELVELGLGGGVDFG